MNRRHFLSTTTAGLAMATALPTALPVAAGTANAADKMGMMPYEQSRKTILGHEMAYVDHGSGRPVVFLHGNPTSSYLWRNVIPHMPEGTRAIAPDLIGMGNSDKPDLPYDYATHAAHLHGLLDVLDLHDVVLVIHDWGGVLGLDWARQNQDRVAGIAFMETLVPPAQPFPSYEAMGPFGELFQAWRTPEVGEQMILKDNMFINEILAKVGVATPLDAETLAHYNSYYPTESSRAPLLEWPRQIPIGGVPKHSHNIVLQTNTYLVDSTIPKLLIYATPGALIPEPVVGWLRENLTNLETADIGAGTHFLQEDNPDGIGKAVAQWMENI